VPSARGTMAGGYRRSLALAFSARFHEWLLPHATVPCSDSHGFSLALAKAGVGRIAFLRHGETAKSEGIDFDRVLTTAGREQAREAGSSFGKDLTPWHQTLLVSPAPRTVETARLFMESAGEANIQVRNDALLYDGTMQPNGSLLFRKIGYAGLETYLNCEDDGDREVARTVLGSYAHSVAHVIRDMLEKDIAEDDHGANKNATTLWIIGHAIYLPAIALGVASILGCQEPGTNLILSTNTVEAEGYLVDVAASTVSLLQRPTNMPS
jgi:hypothetical protein